jgi:hypothetical protein
MNPRVILIAATIVALPVLADAAGLSPWQFGMSKSQVTSFKEFGPYRPFANGDLETYGRSFHGRKANVQFFFQGDRLRRIGVYLYEGTDPKGGIPAWRFAYESLQKDYGKILMPDIRVGPHSDPVNAEVLAISAAVNTDVTGESRMMPAKQPSNIRIFARSWKGLVQGECGITWQCFMTPTPNQAMKRIATR